MIFAFSIYTMWHVEASARFSFITILKSASGIQKERDTAAKQELFAWQNRQDLKNVQLQLQLQQQEHSAAEQDLAGQLCHSQQIAHQAQTAALALSDKSETFAVTVV